MTQILRSGVLVAVLAAALPLAAGCGATKGGKIESETEGAAAAQRQALTRAESQTATQGTAPIPSLVPGEGKVLLPASPAAPPTAPPPDKFDNNNPGHLLARCRDRAARHEWFDAVGDCRRSAELDPSSVEPQVELMRLLVTLQVYGDAEDAAQKVLAQRPNDPVALYYLAWSYRGRDMFPKAAATLERAVAVDPGRVEYVQALGITYCLAGNYGKGIETLERALAMDPGNEKTKASIQSAKSVLQEKLAPYLKVLREHPDAYDNHAAIGFQFQKYGYPQKALAAYDTALAKMPAQQDANAKQIAAQIYYNRGVVYRELGKPELAEPALVQSMQLDASLASFAWYYIGLVRHDAGKYDGAVEALQKSIDLAPDVAENRSALADAYEKAGKADLAREQRNAVAAIEDREAAKKSEDVADRRRRETAADAAAPVPATAPATQTMTPTSAPAGSDSLFAPGSDPSNAEVPAQP